MRLSFTGSMMALRRTFTLLLAVLLLAEAQLPGFAAEQPQQQQQILDEFGAASAPFAAMQQRARQPGFGLSQQQQQMAQQPVGAAAFPQQGVQQQPGFGVSQQQQQMPQQPVGAAASPQQGVQQRAQQPGFGVVAPQQQQQQQQQMPQQPGGAVSGPQQRAQRNFWPRRYCNERVLVANAKAECLSAANYCRNFVNACADSRFQRGDNLCISQAQWVQNFADKNPGCTV
jgi:hypothetical protein